MKHLLFVAAIMSLAIFSVGASLRSAEDNPVVIKAVAPSVYPFAGIAKAVGAVGRVVIEVKISAAGDVTATKPLEGHELLKHVSVEAARQWKFAAGADNRTARLTFTFGIGKEQRISFISPYEIEFIGTVPNVC